MERRLGHVGKTAALPRTALLSTVRPAWVQPCLWHEAKHVHSGFVLFAPPDNSPQAWFNQLGDASVEQDSCRTPTVEKGSALTDVQFAVRAGLSAVEFKTSNIWIDLCG